MPFSTLLERDKEPLDVRPDIEETCSVLNIVLFFIKLFLWVDSLRLKLPNLSCAENRCNFFILSVLLSPHVERNSGLRYANFFTLDVNKQCNVVFSFRASIAKISTTLFKMPTFCAFSSPAPAILCPPPE